MSGYLSFTCDLTAHLPPGRNALAKYRRAGGG